MFVKILDVKNQKNSSIYQKLPSRGKTISHLLIVFQPLLHQALISILYS